jgi:hypothetical protein
VSPLVLVLEAYLGNVDERSPKFIVFEEIEKVIDCGTTALTKTVSLLRILTVVVPESVIGVEVPPVRPIDLLPVVVALMIWFTPVDWLSALVPIRIYTADPAVIGEVPLVINNVVVEILATPTVAPDGTDPSVDEPTYGPPMLMSTSVKVKPAGITNSDGKVISVVEPAAIPVGVVKTNVWLDAVPIFAEDSVSDKPESDAAETFIIPSVATRNPAVIFINVLFIVFV